MIKKQLFNEKGLSLVEVIAASVLLIIVLTSFLSFFLSSKNTGVESKNTVSATYTAQNEMEKIYKKIPSTTNQDELMKNFNYSIPCVDGQSKKYLKTSSKQQEVIIAKLTPTAKQANFVNILISVYDKKDVSITNACTTISHTPKSQMENIVKVGGF